MKNLYAFGLALALTGGTAQAASKGIYGQKAYYQLSDVSITEETAPGKKTRAVQPFLHVESPGFPPSTITSTSTGTGTGTSTSTGTSTATGTSTGTSTGTTTQTGSQTYTATNTATNTGTGSYTNTVTNTATVTNTITNTSTVTITNTSTVTNTATSTSLGGGTAIWDLVLGGDWNAIMLVGNKIVEIVKANQPVVNVKRDAVHAVPAGINDWQLLSGWKAPMSKIYTVSMKNGFGSEVVRVRVKVTANWGGSANGRGQYLANVIMVPVETYVAWGWSLDLWSEHRDPLNAGTFEQPIAGLGFDIRYRVKTYFNDMSGMQDYYMTGDGQLKALAFE